MGNYAGIDLGTTFSAIAMLNSIGKPEIVPNSTGERITPSAVWFDDGNEVVVGNIAKNNRGLEVDRVITEIKRKMGDSEFRFTVGSKDWSPEEISSLILSKLKKDCEQVSGELSKVVITVPAYFDEKRRKATMDAGKIAGLDIIGIINEPTAAALFYATNHDISGKVLVFDLGGGTFDVTVMEVNGNKIDIICSHGDHNLGGIDFDNEIINLMDKQYDIKNGGKLIREDIDRNKYLNDAEEIKKTLSNRDKARAFVDGPNGSLKVEISKDDFEQAISSLVAKSEMLVEAALDEAELSPKEITNVLLVGGSARIPYVQNRLSKIFGFAPKIEVNVDECVALGAAIHAGLKAIQDDSQKVPEGISGGLSDIKLKDVCNHSYGTIAVTLDPHTGKPISSNTIIIKKNTPIPCKETTTFYTLFDNQESVDISVTQGESEDPDYVELIHEQQMELPPNMPANRPVEFAYSYDDNQRMHCTFKDIESDRIKEVKLTRSGDTFDAEAIERSKANLDSFIIE